MIPLTSLSFPFLSFSFLSFPILPFPFLSLSFPPLPSPSHGEAPPSNVISKRGNRRPLRLYRKQIPSAIAVARKGRKTPATHLYVMVIDARTLQKDIKNGQTNDMRHIRERQVQYRRTTSHQQENTHNADPRAHTKDTFKWPNSPSLPSHPNRHPPRPWLPSLVAACPTPSHTSSARTTFHTLYCLP